MLKHGIPACFNDGRQKAWFSFPFVTHRTETLPLVTAPHPWGAMSRRMFFDTLSDDDHFLKASPPVGQRPHDFAE